MTADGVSLTVTDFDEGNPVKADWSSDTNITTSVVFGGVQLFNRDGGNGGVITLDSGEVQYKAGKKATEQRPLSSCPPGECGPKFE